MIRKPARRAAFRPHMEALESVCLLSTMPTSLVHQAVPVHVQPLAVHITTLAGNAAGQANLPRQVGVGAPASLALRGPLTIDGTVYRGATVTGKVNNTTFPPGGNLVIRVQRSTMNLTFIQTDSSHANYLITGGTGQFAGAVGSGTFLIRMGTSSSTHGAWSQPYRINFA